MRWTVDTWCACPECNGPSLPRPVPDIGERVELPAGHVQCHACAHVWRPDGEGWRRAMRMWGEADEEDASGDLWDETVGAWRVRLSIERERMARAMRGEW